MYRSICHREKDDVLYLDLQVNGTLDRETIANYTLVIEASDGGIPPLKGELTVNITILDVNDNEPIFSQTTYYGSVPENASVGLSLLQVTATDADEGDNGLVTYSLHSRVPPASLSSSLAANSLTHFGINKNTGWIFVARPLDFESKNIHELVVIAKDSGVQPLETSAFVSISVTDVNDNQPSISLLFLTENAKPEVPENARIGDLVARISVNDPDNRDNGALQLDASSSPNSLSPGFNVYLSGSEGHFGLTTQDSIVYLIVVTAPLNRQKKSKYTLTITAMDQGTPPLNASTFFNLEVVDKNYFRTSSTAPPIDPIKKISGKQAEKSLMSSEDTRLAVSNAKSGSTNALFTIDPYSVLRKESPFEIETETPPNFMVIAKKQKKSGNSKGVLRGDLLEFEVEESATIGTEIGSINVLTETKDAIKHHSDCLNGYFVDYMSEKENGDAMLAADYPFLIESNDQSNLNIILAKRLDYETRSEYSFTILTDPAQCTVLLSAADANKPSESHSNYRPLSRIKIRVTDDVKDCQPFDVITKDVIENDISMLEIEVPLSEENMHNKAIDIYSLSELSSAGCYKLKLSYALRSPLISKSVLSQLFAINEKGMLQLLPFDRSLVKDLLQQIELIVIIKAYLHLDNEKLFLNSIAAKVKLIKDEERKINEVGFVNADVYTFDEDCCLPKENIIQLKINISHQNLVIRYHFEDELVNNEQSSHFWLDPETGLLSLKEPFDFETRREFKLNVTASVYSSGRGLTGSTSAAKAAKNGRDTAAAAATRIPMKRISHTFTIKINNVNDERPKFAQRIYSTDVLESLPTNSVLMRLEAHDFDFSSNLTFLIPFGHATSNQFAIDPRSGVLSTKAPLDRERQARYRIPIYVFDDDYKHHDLAIVTINLLDINDNPPLFSNPNQVIKIPENIASGTIFHTLVAFDKDLIIDNSDAGVDINGNSGGNSSNATSSSSSSSSNHLQYRILSGNQANKFTINHHLGHLSTLAPLDRERQEIYHLVIEVSDFLYNSTCNVTIEVMDVNDNAPIFEKSVYYALIDENNLHGGDQVNVLTVKAIDPDFKDKIYYTINATETPEAMYFNIDSFSGLITTTPAALSHAKKSKASEKFRFTSLLRSTNFSFNVYAVDIGFGSYATHTSKASIHVTVVNNQQLQSPRLISYPYIIELNGFKEDYKSGTQIGKLSVEGKSDGEANFVFQVIAENPTLRLTDYFNVDSKTGAITVKRSLASSYFECYVQVQRVGGLVSTTALLQIFISGDAFTSADQKAKRIKGFHYKVELYENVPQGTELINLLTKSKQTLLDSGRYKFEFAYTSVDQNYFHLNPNNGVISVRKVLDYETDPSLIELIVVAKKHRFSFDNPFIFNVSISLLNINDNAPQFTQNHYVATVKESENRGTFVAQISALDIDNVSNFTNDKIFDKRRRNTLTYHILEGNYDNAFIIDPPGSGIVKTNIVLDREIRDFYQLKIVASDEGAAFDARDGRSFGSNLHLTSYCTLEINVIDINDNVPVFPPYQEINVKEDTEIGSIISALTANDVDTFPPLTYVKHKLDMDDSDHIFDIGLYTGKITLKSAISGFERAATPKVYKLNIFASDSLHSAETQVVVKIKRNENEFFTNDSFLVEINPADDECISTSSLNCHIMDISPSRSEYNSHNSQTKVCYLMNSSANQSFSVDRFKGTITNSRNLVNEKSAFYQLSVSAFYCRDNGRIVSEEKARSSIMIRVAGYRRARRIAPIEEANLEVMRDNSGESLLKLSEDRYKFEIIEGNYGNVFALKGGNELIMVKKATRSEYKLHIKSVKSKKNNNSNEVITVNVKVLGKDKESLSPAFRFKVFTIRLKESRAIGEEVIKVKSDDNRVNYRYTLFSGNELNSFRIDSTTGIIYVNNSLNYSVRDYYQLNVLAFNQNGSDVGLAVINIIITNTNNHSPVFALTQYKAVVAENTPVGSKVMKIEAYDEDGSAINYTLIRTIDGLAPFMLDSRTGYLITTEAIDYENFKVDIPLYKLVLKAVDFDHKTSSSEVLVEIQIGSKDEFPPKFTIESYDFKVATSYGLPYVKVGQVAASDADLGPDGNVVYSLRSSSPANAFKKFFLNSTTGLITINALSKEHIPPKYTSLIVSASSGRIDSLSSLAVVEVTIHIIDDLKGVAFDDTENFISSSSSASNPLPTALPGWTLFLIVFLMIITVVLLVSIIVIRLHQQQHQSMVNGLSSVHNFVPGVSTLLRKIGRTNNTINPVSDGVYGQHPANAPPHHHHHHHVQYLVTPSTLPPCYSEVTTTTNVGEGHSASSGRGSAEDEVEEDMDEADEEIRMIIEGNDYYDQCDTSVPTTAEYLARLGVIDHHEEDEDDDRDDVEDELNIPIDDVHSDPGEVKMRPQKLFSSVRSQRPRQPSEEWSKINGSLSSIVQSEEELNGAYNWNYLQDWGPKYQPLSSVFAEIAKLKGGLNLNEGQSFDNNLNKVETASTISTSTAGSSHSHYRKNVSDILMAPPQPQPRPRQQLLSELSRIAR
ncbi:Cadherin-like protein 3 [Dinothrombium tinctorium]|uniref:Cadherin-like protein 3 n=1 Tax=Dinothrombium tinctorium TaxID=1965070 RepID=A0A3S3PED3_9ACAR|nr:Cadherin-like protein 3 [Dinothrombium tinctorium]